MIVNNFIVNSDFDGPKEFKEVEASITTPRIEFDYHNPLRTYQVDFDAPSGEFFTNVSAYCSLVPGIAIPNTQFTIAKHQTDNWDHMYNYSMNIFRVSATKMRLYIAISDDTEVTGGTLTVVPEITVNAKVRFYAASLD